MNVREEGLGVNMSVLNRINIGNQEKINANLYHLYHGKKARIY